MAALCGAGMSIERPWVIVSMWCQTCHVKSREVSRDRIRAGRLVRIWKVWCQ